MAMPKPIEKPTFKSELTKEMKSNDFSFNAFVLLVVRMEEVSDIENLRIVASQNTVGCYTLRLLKKTLSQEAFVIQATLLFDEYFHTSFEAYKNSRIGLIALSEELLEVFENSAVPLSHFYDITEFYDTHSHFLTEPSISLSERLTTRRHLYSAILELRAASDTFLDTSDLHLTLRDASAAFREATIIKVLRFRLWLSKLPTIFNTILKKLR